MSNLRDAIMEALYAVVGASHCDLDNSFAMEEQRRLLDRAFRSLFKANGLSYEYAPKRKPYHISYVCPQCHWSCDVEEQKDVNVKPS